MHQHAGKVAVCEEVFKDIQHLSVKQRRRGEFSGRCGAGEHEDSGADNRPDPQCGQRPGPQSFLQPCFRALRVGDQFVDGLLGKKLAGQKGLLGSMNDRPGLNRPQD